MTANADDPLLSAAAKISSGEPVDWKEITDQIETPDQAAVAEELRSLERYAHVLETPLSAWGRYQIVGQIGVGTFGTVYRAIDQTLRHEVALKITRPRSPHDPAEREKALEEARRLVKVKHPNVVRAFGADRIGEEIGLAMELVSGHTLDEIVRRQGPYSASEATVIGIDLCRALAAVHRAGILHGDIKAHNVMREEGGRTVLMDFGTSRDLSRQPSGHRADFAGTPLYLAPEVFAGAPRTMASEIYSLGVLLYFLVTSAHPIEGDTRTAVERQHNHGGTPKSLRDVRPDLPDGFIRVVERALDPDPTRRFASAGALEAGLAQVLPASAQQPVPATSSWAMKVALAAVVLLVLGVGSATVFRLLSRAPAVENVHTEASPPSIAAASASPAPVGGSVAEYRVEAAFYREHAAGGVERMTSSSIIAPDDKLSLQFHVSRPSYVYVVNEDERGESHLLFPLPGLALTNPVPSGQRHRLPGMWSGGSVSWQVTSPGDKEHFLIVVSPERSRAFEEMFATLPQPTFGKPVLSRRLSDEELEVFRHIGEPGLDWQTRLRSVGGLTASPAQPDRQLRLLPEFSTPLAESEEVASGVWIRHAVFINPLSR